LKKQITGTVTKKILENASKNINLQKITDKHTKLFARTVRYHSSFQGFGSASILCGSGCMVLKYLPPGSRDL